METDDPIKKNDEINNDSLDAESSNEQLDQPEQTEPVESEMSGEETFEPVDGELEIEQETTETQDKVSDSDQSSLEASETEPAVVVSSLSEPPAKPMPKWLKYTLIYLVVGIVLLLAGYLIAYFTSTVPKQNLYQNTVNQLQETESQLDDMNTKYEQLSEDFSSLNEEHDALQSDYQSLIQSYDDLEENSEFYKNLLSLKYEVANARYYLLKVDKISARQAMILAFDYFDGIKDKLEPDIASGIEDRLESIQKSIYTKPDTALDDLGTLFENLERIPTE